MGHPHFQNMHYNSRMFSFLCRATATVHNAGSIAFYCTGKSNKPLLAKGLEYHRGGGHRLHGSP